MWIIDVLLNEFAWYRCLSNCFYSKTTCANFDSDKNDSWQMCHGANPFDKLEYERMVDSMSPKLSPRETNPLRRIYARRPSSTAFPIYDCIHYDFTIFDRTDLFACHAAIYIGGFCSNSLSAALSTPTQYGDKRYAGLRSDCNLDSKHVPHVVPL